MITVPMLQDEGEIERFAALLAAEGVKSYLEIGSHSGGSLYTVMRALTTGCRAVAVDLPGGAGGSLDAQQRLEQVVAALNASDRSVQLILGNSHSPGIVRQVAALGPFDAVLIDADHTYAAAAADWANYGPLGRIVAFHDIASTQRWIEVPQFWSELREGRRHVEIIGERPGFGLGVLWNEVAP